MKNKKLLISLAAVAVVIVIVVVMIAVFAVESVEVRYHNFDGKEILATEGEGIVPDEILKSIKGKSTVFLSKTDLINDINQKYGGYWHAFAVVKNFPNRVEVHVVKTTIIAKISINTTYYYLDNFGNVVENTSEEDIDVVDITAAFEAPNVDANTPQYNTPLTFKGNTNNVRLKCVLEAILATWRCYVEVKDMTQILNVEAFKFDADNLLIYPKNGGLIKVFAPETNLSNRLIKAYGVYFNDKYNTQTGDWIITVHKNGSITTDK